MNIAVKTWRSDKHLLLFALNFILVIVGYGFAGITNKASNAIIQPFKVVLLGYSFYQILIIYNRIPKSDSSDNRLFLLFNSLIIGTMLFSVDFFQTLSRSFQFLFPFLYLFLFDKYIRSVYSRSEILKGFLTLINFTYCIPIICFYIFGGSLELGDIYGEAVGGFVSNHYGWASLLFILSFTDLYFNKQIGYYHKWLGFILIIPAFYLLIISGNRASYLSLAIVLLVFLIRNTKVHLIFKSVLIIISIFYVAETLNDSNSALSKRLLKTQNQLKDEEEFHDTRKTARKIGWRVMDKHPENYLTGFGFFSFKEAISMYEPNIKYDLIKTGVHNSYLEFFFGCGMIVFAIFLIFYIIQPIGKYLINYSSRYLFVLPLFIIPFFESNLGGGQFLFYPWFAAIFLFRK